VARLAGSDLIIERAYEELNRFGWSVEELRLYDRVEMKRASDIGVIHAAREDGRAEGIAEGKTETLIDMARKMFAKGKTIEEVIEFVDLTHEQLAQLKK
jgi:predicted transposase/invertase (TIGR01784 family)